MTYAQQPSRLPIWSTATIWLVLDRLHAPGWAWGVAGTVVVVAWIGAIVSISVEDNIELKELL